jgi:hypothetical protein
VGSFGPFEAGAGLISATTAAPAGAVSVTAPAATNDNTPTVPFSSTVAGAFTCSIDSVPAAACASPVTTGQLADGQHTLTVNETDGLGHPSNPGVATFTVDTAGPVVSITSGPKGATRQRRPSFAFSSPEPTTAFACSLDGAPGVPCTSAVRPARPLSQGNHTFTVQGTDPLGNVGAPKARSFKVDTRKPSVSFKKHPARKTRSRKAKFSYKASESGVKFKCKLDRKPAKPCKSKTKLKHLKRGKHKFTVTATDAAGNASKKSFSWRVKG